LDEDNVSFQVRAGLRVGTVLDPGFSAGAVGRMTWELLHIWEDQIHLIVACPNCGERREVFYESDDDAIMCEACLCTFKLVIRFEVVLNT
jgi:hypothetical protein